MRDGATDIRIAGRGFIHELRFEVGADRRHEVHGVGAAEIAMHALPLLQGRVGDLGGTQHRLITAG